MNCAVCRSPFAGLGLRPADGRRPTDRALREMVVGGYIADMITNLAMLDPILGGIDR